MMINDNSRVLLSGDREEVIIFMRDVLLYEGKIIIWLLAYNVLKKRIKKGKKKV